jgi:predicted dehydrogenase
VHTDLSHPEIPEREVPEHVQVVAEFPTGFVANLTCSTVNAKAPSHAIHGQKATLEVSGSGEQVVLVPEREFERSVQPELFEKMHPEDLDLHLRNWFDSIRSGKQTVANIDLAIRVQTIISLAEMSDRLRVACLFDSESRKIIDGTGKQLEPITYGSFENS